MYAFNGRCAKFGSNSTVSIWQSIVPSPVPLNGAKFLKCVLSRPKLLFHLCLALIPPIWKSLEDKITCYLLCKTHNLKKVLSTWDTLVDEVQHGHTSSQKHEKLLLTIETILFTMVIHSVRVRSLTGLRKYWQISLDRRQKLASLLKFITSLLVLGGILVIAVQKAQPARIFEPISYNSTFDSVYAKEVGPRFADGDHFMDYTGTGLYLNSQIDSIRSLLVSGVFGNPHSKSSSSIESTERVEEMRDTILDFFSADPTEYEIIFTKSATGALALLAESFPWSRGGNFAHLVSNHNSVLGIRSVAQAHGAHRVGACTEKEVEMWLAGEKTKNPIFHDGDGGPGVRYSILAYPKKDNFNGVLYPSSWIEKIHGKSSESHKWMVILDAAAYAPTHKLDLSKFHPDFVCVSFYKLFGFPTGVGALIIKKTSARILQRAYWGGSSVFTATATLPWEIRFEGTAKWEDGTLPFLEIISLKAGFEAMEMLGGIEAVHDHVALLTKYLSQELRSLVHSNGQPMVRLFGHHYDNDRIDNNEWRQSGIANFQLLKPSGDLFSYRDASRMLSNAGFHVRDGCMCNPGSCYAAAGVQDEEVKALAKRVHGDYADWEWIDVERDEKKVTLPLGSIRVSLGWVSRISDIDALVEFLNSTYKDIHSAPMLSGEQRQLRLRC